MLCASCKFSHRLYLVFFFSLNSCNRRSIVFYLLCTTLTPFISATKEKWCTAYRVQQFVLCICFGCLIVSHLKWMVWFGLSVGTIARIYLGFAIILSSLLCTWYLQNDHWNNKIYLYIFFSNMYCPVLRFLPLNLALIFFFVSSFHCAFKMSFIASSIDRKFSLQKCYLLWVFDCGCIFLRQTNTTLLWNAHKGIENESPSDRKRRNIIRFLCVIKEPNIKWFKIKRAKRNEIANWEHRRFPTYLYV